MGLALGQIRRNKRNARSNIIMALKDGWEQLDSDKPSLFGEWVNHCERNSSCLNCLDSRIHVSYSQPEAAWTGTDIVRTTYENCELLTFPNTWDIIGPLLSENATPTMPLCPPQAQSTSSHSLG